MAEKHDENQGAVSLLSIDDGSYILYHACSAADLMLTRDVDVCTDHDVPVVLVTLQYAVLILLDNSLVSQAPLSLCHSIHASFIFYIYYKTII